MGWSQTLPVMFRIGVTVSILLMSNLYHVKGDVVVYNAENNTVRFASMPSNFGNRIPSDGLTGFLVSADPYDGCSTIAPPPETNNTVQVGYIALIRRNDCDFDLKVLNAQRSGYMGAIVHNVGSNGLVPMSGSKYAGQVFIPSVFVGDSDGQKLGSEYNYTTGKPVKLTPYISLPPGYYLFPFITVTATCLLFFSIYMVAKYVRDRRRLRRARLSKDHLKKIPIKKFKKGDDYDVCAICLDEYEEGDKLRILPCNHAFHSKCVDPWLTNNRRTCPVCKRKVVPKGMDDSSDDDSSSDEDGPNENTPLLAAASNNSASTPEESEVSGSLPGETARTDASTAMTPAEDSDEESAVSSSDSYEMAHTHPGTAPGTTHSLEPVTEIQIEHEVLVERPDESDDSDDHFIDDDNARLQKV